MEVGKIRAMSKTLKATTTSAVPTKLSRWLELEHARNGSERVKKKRGKPRKYRPETGKASLGFVPGPPSFTVSQPSGYGGGSGGGGISPIVKKMRERPTCSNKRQKLQI
ncbi:hypothetical protein YC2023_042744 [Brassica napus]